MSTYLKFSVVIPCRNAGEFIRATLNSVRKQSYPNLEVIIIDGCSTDDTTSAIAEFDDIVSLFTSEPDLGQLHALQKGVKCATGDVILWLNADDIVMPNAFHYVNDVMRDHSIDLVFSDDFAFDAKAKQLYVGPSIKNFTYFDHILFYRQMYSECIYWRRKATKLLAEDYNTFRICTDYAFFVNLRFGLKEIWVPKRLGAFRIRANQASVVNRAVLQKEFKHIRNDQYNRLGLKHENIIVMKIAHATSFWLRQWLWPNAERVLRRTIRLVSGDSRRKKMTAIFYDSWLGTAEATSEELRLLQR
jgi:glycosyltransferase involved in cell wall biosynthesis